jgi:acyl-CoA reductase-like NAD-dependent aldehyde dehydrogenase
MNMGSETISTISPATNKVILECPGTSIEEATRRAKIAEKAYRSWRHTSLSHRRAVVEKALALVQERKVTLGEELTMQMGRPIAYSVKEIETMQKRATYLLQTAEEALADLPGIPEEGFTRYIRKDPVGPVLVVFAWNVRRQTDHFFDSACEVLF